uniref:Uncharacterized protein n=1 Tax=Megaselia scalaris TaxID=36166 RepID=T1GYK3_MEGSC
METSKCLKDNTKLKHQFMAILLATLFGLAACRPSFIHTEPELSYGLGYKVVPTVVGHSLHSVPTAVSHQSQTIVHEKRPYLRPVIHHTPVYKTIGHEPVVDTTLLNGVSPYGVYNSLYNDWNPWYLK